MDAHSPRATHPHAWSRTLILGATLLVLCVAGLTARAPISRASGFSPIQITPGTVTPGMKVSITLDVPVVPPAPIPLRLYVTLQQPAQTNCPGMEPVPGLSTLTITPPNNWAKATFAWPAQLGVGTWWFCTIDTDTNSLFSVSDPDQPLVVVATIPPPTATPLPSAVTIEGATTTIPAGASVTIDITNWDTSQQLVDALVIIDQQPNVGKTADSLVVRVVALNPANTLVISVTLNQNLAPGSYYLILTSTQSNTFTTPSFTVVAAVPTAVATAPALAISVPGPQQQPGSGPPLAAYILIAALLLAAATVTVAAVRRRSA